MSKIALLFVIVIGIAGVAAGQEPTPETPCIGWPLPPITNAGGAQRTVKELKTKSPFSVPTAKVALWVVYDNPGGGAPTASKASGDVTWDDYLIDAYVPGFRPPPSGVAAPSPPGSGHIDELKWKMVGFTDESAVGVIIHSGPKPPKPPMDYSMMFTIIVAAAAAVVGLIVGAIFASRRRV